MRATRDRRVIDKKKISEHLADFHSFANLR